MNKSRLIRGCTVVVAVAALGLTAMASPASAAEPRSNAKSAQAAQATLLAALQRDLKVSASEAKQLLSRQGEVNKLSENLAAQLGADFGGSWYDRATDKLVVAVTKAERAGLARAAGAEATVVKRSLQSLDAIKAELDSLAKQDKARLSAAASWSVDAQANQVVVTVHKGQADALGSVVARHGDAVRIEQSDIAPSLAADFLDGGDPYNGCSVGFNVSRGGVGHFLTAGHCGTAGTMTQQAGVNIGPVVQSFFPTFDDALVRNDNPGFWIQGPWVFAYNGDPNSVYNINGFKNSIVGTTVCKSGRTTGLTCGVITAKNQTVNYPQGTVFGLTRHSACVEQGDSGGSNISFVGGNFAEGMTSGAQMSPDSTGRLRCQQFFGRANVSWFFPIAPSISFYGVTLMTV